MKKIVIFIFSIILCYIICSLQSCIQEKDQSQCQKHTIEQQYNFFSCFKYENEDEDNVCVPFYNTEKTQKTYRKYLRGYQKINVVNISIIWNRWWCFVKRFR